MEQEYIQEEPKPDRSSTIDFEMPQTQSEFPGAVKGAKVRHAILGEGEIQSISSQGQARYVTCILRGTKRMFQYPDIFLDGRLIIIESEPK